MTGCIDRKVTLQSGGGGPHINKRQPVVGGHIDVTRITYSDEGTSATTRSILQREKRDREDTNKRVDINKREVKELQEIERIQAHR